jgi:hypothetical protein
LRAKKLVILSLHISAAKKLALRTLPPETISANDISYGISYGSPKILEGGSFLLNR